MKSKQPAAKRLENHQPSSINHQPSRISVLAQRRYYRPSLEIQELSRLPLSLLLGPEALRANLRFRLSIAFPRVEETFLIPLHFNWAHLTEIMDRSFRVLPRQEKKAKIDRFKSVLIGKDRF
jgi:hypothetical protein